MRHVNGTTRGERLHAAARTLLTFGRETQGASPGKRNRMTYNPAERTTADLLLDWSAILRERLGERAAKVPTRNAPTLLVRAMSLFDSSLRSIGGDLGKSANYSHAKARERLGWQPRPVADSIADTGESPLAVGTQLTRQAGISLVDAPHPTRSCAGSRW